MGTLEYILILHLGCSCMFMEEADSKALKGSLDPSLWILPLDLYIGELSYPAFLDTGLIKLKIYTWVDTVGELT